MSDGYPKSPATPLAVTSAEATGGLTASILNLPIAVSEAGGQKLSAVMKARFIEACRLGISRPLEYRWLDMAARGEMSLDILLDRFSESVRRRLSPEWNHLGRGIEFYRRGQWESAINEFRAAFVKLFQGSAHAARMKHTMGKSDPEGESRLRRSFFQVYKQSLKEHGDLRVAGRDLRELAGLFPDAWDAHLCLAEVLKGCGEFDEATVEYREAMRLGGAPGPGETGPAN